MNVMTIAEAEAYFKAGGKVERKYRNMPAFFETEKGRITRQAVNVLYHQDRIKATTKGIGALYEWWNGD